MVHTCNVWTNLLSAHYAIPTIGVVLYANLSPPRYYGGPVPTSTPGPPEEVDAWGGSLIFVVINNSASHLADSLHVCICMFYIYTQTYDHVFHCNT